MLDPRMKLVIPMAVAIALTACGAPANQPAGANTPAAQPTLPSFNNSENGGEGGVEAALVTYTDTAQGFSIGYPGTWTRDTSVTDGVRFAGGDDSLTLTIVTPPSGADPSTYAQGDVAALTTAYPGFKQLSLNVSTEVPGAAVLGFEANGQSAVTGKAYKAHDERYYIPLKDGRLAILTVTGPDNHYDREGVRDIALTIKAGN